MLSLGACAFTLLQSLVVPALPVLQKELHTTPAGVAWVFTAYLLSASVVTPIAGRLGDMFGKRLVLLIALGGLAAGSLVAALATTLPVMIFARTIQGVGGAIFPLAFGIVRDEFPRERVAGAIGLISGIFAIGGGIGILLAGPILENLSYHWLFWIPLLVVGLSIPATALLVPESPVRAPGRVFWLGAVLLSGWLVALLLGVTKATDWGWGDPKTIGLFLLSAVLAVTWVWAEMRARDPLVDIPMMRLRPVWTTNLATFLLGFGLYISFVLIPQYVSAPTSTGYGLGASVTQAGLYLLPMTLALTIASPIGGRLSHVTGAKLPLVLGTSLAAVALWLLSVAREPWELYTSSGLMGTGVGLAFAAIANLIVAAVRADQTAVASGMNTIVRTIGGAIGAEIGATILAANMLRSGYPDQHGYTVTFLVAGIGAALGAAASLLVPGRRSAGTVPAPTPAPAVSSPRSP